MLSVVIIAKDEAFHLRQCLESVRWADEIVVVDSGSTDNTVAIAKEFTPNVFVMTDWQGYGVQKQRALSQATGDWVLNLDADESVSEALRAAIQSVMNHNELDACRVPIRMVFYGKLMRFSSSPKRHIRLFKREGARYSEDIVHEKVVLPANARIGKLSPPIRHQSFRDLSHALYKVNRYSSYSAAIRINDGKRAGLTKALAASCWMFFRCYILQCGFLDGKAGFILALLNAQGALFRGLKQVYLDKEGAKP